MDDNGWFVTLCMYLGMLFGLLLEGPRRFARRYPRAFVVLMFGVCVTPIAYIDFVMKQDAQALGLSMILAIALCAGAIAFLLTRNDDTQLESEPAPADPNNWFID